MIIDFDVQTDKRLVEKIEPECLRVFTLQCSDYKVQNLNFRPGFTVHLPEKWPLKS